MPKLNKTTDLAKLRTIEIETVSIENYETVKIEFGFKDSEQGYTTHIPRSTYEDWIEMNNGLDWCFNAPNGEQTEGKMTFQDYWENADHDVQEIDAKGFLIEHYSDNPMPDIGAAITDLLVAEQTSKAS